LTTAIIGSIIAGAREKAASVYGTETAVFKFDRWSRDLRRTPLAKWDHMFEDLFAS
jgi:hypothetical protein